VSKRLEITLFGTCYRMCVLKLSQAAVRAGMKIYGAGDWKAKTSSIALAPNGKALCKEISHTIGHTIAIVHQGEGIALQGAKFGMEIFHGGNFTPVEFVEADNKTLLPDTFLADCKKNDMLGVSWAKRDGAMFFRWNDVDRIDEKDICLTYDRLGPILGRKRALDIVVDVTFRGKSGQKKKDEANTEYTPIKHVFHVKK